MRKLAFYPHLALGNLWRNKQTYFPYLLASISCVITLYSLLAIKSTGHLATMQGGEIVEIFVIVGLFVLGIFCAVMLFWTNSFLIKRRKKELALYSVLGMEKRNIAIIMFFETLFVMIISLLVGIIGGILISKLIFLILLKLIKYEIAITLGVSVKAIMATITYFAVVFALSLLSNLRQVRIANPIEMMSGAKQGEKEPKSSILITIIGVIFLGLGYGIALYFKNPTQVILFFLIAALCVIIGTYCLFTSGSIAVLKAMRKRKSYYYTPKHFISVSGMIYRMKQNAAGLATICVLSCMVMVTVAATTGLYAGIEHNIDKMLPNDYEIVIYSKDDFEQVEQVINNSAEQYNISIEDKKIYSYYYTGAKINNNNCELAEYAYYEDDTILMHIFKASEYEKSENEDLNLAKGEALFYTTQKYKYNDININGYTYEIRKTNKVPIGQSGSAEDFHMLVLQDDEYNALVSSFPEKEAEEGRKSTSRMNYCFYAAGNEENREIFTDGLLQNFDEAEISREVNIIIRDDMREAFYFLNGGFLFLGSFFGIIFLLAATMIMYYKQLSEGYDDAERFEILQKVGMSEQEVRKTISTQVRSVFFLPLLVAAIHISVAFVPVRRAMVVFGITDIVVLLLSFAVTMLVYALVYLFVYRRTAAVYFRIVRRD